MHVQRHGSELLKAACRRILAAFCAAPSHGHGHDVGGGSTATTASVACAASASGDGSSSSSIAAAAAAPQAAVVCGLVTASSVATSVAASNAALSIGGGQPAAEACPLLLPAPAPKAGLLGDPKQAMDAEWALLRHGVKLERLAAMAAAHGIVVQPDFDGSGLL
jgi:hypothetical protein